MSFVVMESADLRNWCDNVIQTIMEERDRLWRRMIDERLKSMNRPRGRFITWLRGRKIYVEQDAIDSLMAYHDLIFSDYNMYVENLHEKSLDVAERLKGATEVGSRVHVDTQDIVTMKSYRRDQ